MQCCGGTIGLNDDSSNSSLANAIQWPAPQVQHRIHSTARFGFALGFPVAFILLAVLEATHTPDVTLAADNPRVAKVFLCVLFAAMCTVLSAITAALPLSRGNFWPLVWLVAIAGGWWAFVEFYDWTSLA